MSDDKDPKDKKDEICIINAITVYDSVHKMIREGYVDKKAIKRMFPDIKSWKFELEWHKARMRLLEDQGITLTRVRGRPGVYGRDDSATTLDKAINRTRLHEIHVIERRQSLLVDAQKSDALSPEHRARINSEELRHGRFVFLAQRDLLLRHRRKPPGV